jgi:hypothetical protein
MAKKREPAPKTDGPTSEQNRPGPGTVAPEEEDCRCKEVSKKSLPELIKMMLRDLTFRRKD